MRTIEPILAAPYRKDPQDEDFLRTLNTRLAIHESYEPLPERYPTLHIIGVARSGTTLVNQLIARHLDVGYINHLIAALWKAPITGIRLSRKVLRDARPPSLESNFGRTSGVTHPHEFGYFWNDLLGTSELRELTSQEADSVEWDHIARVLTHMTYAFEKPVLFKSVQIGPLLDRLQSVLPKTCWIWVQRDPVDTARSILKMREQFLGDREQWASVKPLAYAKLMSRPVWEQVAGQVLATEQSIAAAVKAVNGYNVLQVRYEEICEDPVKFLEAVHSLLRKNGSKVSWTDEPLPKPLQYRHAPEDEDTARIRQIFRKLRDSLSCL